MKTVAPGFNRTENSETMAKLILIKHARPLVDPAKSSELWDLSEEGRTQAKTLAAQLANQSLASVISSEEPKARQTAEILSGELEIPMETAADLHEHDRRNVPHMRSSKFISNVELFFRRHDQLVLGRESADAALARFERAVQNVLNSQADQNVAIVSHGTVIALFIEKHSDRNGFQVWREMSLPSFAIFDLPETQLHELRNRL
jgi:broad specificity phosphatase PhoE